MKQTGVGEGEANRKVQVKSEEKKSSREKKVEISLRYRRKGGFESGAEAIMGGWWLGP